MSQLNANANYISFGNPKLLWAYGNVETFVQNGYQIIKFYYQSGSTASDNGTGSFIMPDNKEVEFLVIGGGGTGGRPGRTSGLNQVSAQYAAGAAGGGAGALATGSFYALKGITYNVVVGKGGTRTYGPQINPSGDPARNGAPSLLNGTSAQGSISLYVPGGGAGGSCLVNTYDPATSGSIGGSGGGAGCVIVDPGPSLELSQSGSAATGTGTAIISFASFQNAGGIASDSGLGINTFGYLGGGGGSSQVGGNASLASNIGGNGGSGSFNAISGSGQYFAGGGAGGYLSTDPNIGYFGLAGVGGGGGATNPTTNGTLGFALGDGVEGTGGGGAPAYNGGSGIIILKYRIGGISLNGAGAA